MMSRDSFEPKLFSDHQFRISFSSHSDLSLRSARSNRCKSSNLAFELKKTRRIKTFQQRYLSYQAVLVSKLKKKLKNSLR